MMSDAILQTVDLNFQWPTIDPFLFCVHHLDHYPEANANLGPDADLAGRDIGSDFTPKDGWRMYHGSTVPGFPQHPHRGFETVTYVRHGLIDHSDSMGARARYGGGDIQWLTAGAGIQHAEMFPLVHRDQPNTLELFQIWLNLPAADKMVEPHFTMLWDDDVPRHEYNGVEVTVIAGRLAGTEAPPDPPPASWASKPESDLAIWVISMQPGSSWTLPAATGSETARVLYHFEGGGLTVDGTPIDPSSGVVVDARQALELTATDRLEVLMLQGRPLGEPVAQYGPFVMNTKAEIEAAFEDYRRTQFGGWPFDRPDPVHGAEHDRFAEHPNGVSTGPSTRPTGATTGA